MGCGIWDMGYGIWDVGYGIWDMGYGIWDIIKGNERGICKVCWSEWANRI